MRYRVGRHNPQLVYSVLTDDPEDRGALLAVCFTAGVAEQVVKALNAAEPQPVDEPVSVSPPGGTSAIPLEQAIAEACADSPEFAAAYAKAEQRADKPAPVPPPVDALLKLIGVYGQARYAVGAAEGSDNEAQATKWRTRAAAAHETVTDEVNALWAAGVEEGRRQATEERTEEEYGVRVDAVHPSRKEKVGTVMTHLGEQKSRMCHDIWDGWTPVKRTVRPAVHGRWEALDEAERLRAPWKRDAEAADGG